MNIIRFITRPFSGKTEKNTNEDIEKVYMSFINGNEKQQIKELNNLIESSFEANDLSFLGFHITMLLSCQSIDARIAGFIASSVFLTQSSPYTEMLPAIYRKAFRTEELVLPALFSCSFLVTPFVFRSIENDIFEIVKSGNYINRKYALHIIFRVYQQDPTVLKKLLPLLRGALFQPSLKYTACSMLCEICNDHSKDVFPFADTIISEIPVATPFIFTKVSRIIIALLKLRGEISSVIERPIQQFVSRNSSPIALIDAANVLANGNFSEASYVQLGSKIQNILTESNSESCIVASLLGAIKCLGHKFKPNPSVIIMYSDSQYELIKSLALTIKLTHSPKTMQSPVDLYKFVRDTKDTFSAKELLRTCKKEDEIYVSMLQDLYEQDIPGIEDDIAEAILSIKDQKTRDIFLNKVYETIFEPSDNKVGISVCHAISEWSNNPEDIKILIPPTISRKSEIYQATLLTDALSFWLRLRFTIENGVLNRIKVLTQSQYCEVRTCARQMLDIIEAENSE